MQRYLSAHAPMPPPEMSAPLLGEPLRMHGHTPLQANDYSFLGGAGECVQSCCTCGMF